METEWKEEKFIPDEKIINLISNFPMNEVGIKIKEKNLIREIDFFELFFSEEIYQEIISESNRYFREKYLNPQIVYSSGTWQFQYIKKSIDIEDLKSYISILLSMSIVKLPKKECIGLRTP